MNQMNHRVFWPPFLLLLAAAIYSLMDTVGFLENAGILNTWILKYFGWLFSLATLSFLGICIWIYFSKIGNTKIGGATAQPFLNKWRWFSITLCTTIATGILFWGAAEPLFHYHNPPLGLNIIPESTAAITFSLSTMFLHWTFTPYGIYTLAALSFALAYYNLRQPFSIGSMLFPLFGKQIPRGWSDFLDGLCLFSLTMGMAASLGAGILLIAGGLETLFNIEKSSFLLAVIALSIVIVFIISAASGLMKGIQLLSSWNIVAFIALGLFVFLCGPTLYILDVGTESLGEYFQTFFQKSLYTGAAAEDGWAKSWTIFYWANWMAWTPVTAVFLGRLTYGYTIREVIRFNLIYPSLFGCFWMMIFSGSALYFDINDYFMMHEAVKVGGFERAIFYLFQKLPLSSLTSIFFLGIAFLSYVTAADSNTSAMSGISSVGISPESPEPALSIKIAWGVAIGLVAWIMVTFADIEGIKTASNLGGFPALFLLILVAIGLVKMILKDLKRYSETEY
jgi:choline-glycine betaine transporter